jgi:hypothetical protein
LGDSFPHSSFFSVFVSFVVFTISSRVRVFLFPHVLMSGLSVRRKGFYSWKIPLHPMIPRVLLGVCLGILLFAAVATVVAGTEAARVVSPSVSLHDSAVRVGVAQPNPLSTNVKQSGFEQHFRENFSSEKQSRIQSMEGTNILQRMAAVARARTKNNLPLQGGIS